jgi:hypothetical protein
MELVVFFFALALLATQHSEIGKLEKRIEALEALRGDAGDSATP